MTQGAALIVDEAFADFFPEVSVGDMVADGLYVARSLTKFFAVPGLRLGALICGDPELARSFQPSWSVNAVAAAAGIAAARETGFADRSLVELKRLREGTAVGARNRTGHRGVSRPRANFLLLRSPPGTVEEAGPSRRSRPRVRSLPGSRTRVPARCGARRGREPVSGGRAAGGDRALSLTLVLGGDLVVARAHSPRSWPAACG